MKVILATDFSQENQTLVPYALDLLKGTGGTIVLFHAFHEDDNVTKSSALAKMDSCVALLNDGINTLQAEHVRIVPRFEVGDPETLLLRLIASEKADLVLMGTRGRGRKRFLEGSLSKKLMLESPVPLLSIHEEYQYKPSSEVLYATSLNKSDVKNISKIFELLKPFNPHLHVIHFILDQEPEKASKAMKKLEDSLKYMDFADRITYKFVNTTSTKSAMKTYCEENQISLAAFIPYRKRFYHLFYKDTFTKEDFYDLHIPLLTFKR